MPPKVIFIDTVHSCLQEELEKLGYGCELHTDLPREEILSIIHEYTGIVIRSRITIDKELLNRATALKFIARSGSGMENIDVSYAAHKKIRCLNSPEGNSDAVAEHAIGMLLALLNKLCHADSEVREGKWNREKNRGIELKGKKVGIIGYGNTGAAFAHRLLGFGVTIAAYDKYKTNYGNSLVEESNMDELYKKADIISLHVPLTNETHYLVNDAFINRFRKKIYIINTSRGPVVKTNDLVKNIKSGKVLGTCLDVLEYEEASLEIGKIALSCPETEAYKTFHYLAESENVILSPHVAGWTVESYRKLSQVLAEKIKQAFH